MTDNTFKNCVTCDRVMTKLDDHQECFRHRVCNVAFPCEVCKLWSAEKRATIDRMIEKARTKLVSATVTTESVPSVGNPSTLPTASCVPVWEVSRYRHNTLPLQGCSLCNHLHSRHSYFMPRFPLTGKKNKRRSLIAF